MILKHSDYCKPDQINCDKTFIVTRTSFNTTIAYFHLQDYTFSPSIMLKENSPISSMVHLNESNYYYIILNNNNPNNLVNIVFKDGEGEAYGLLLDDEDEDIKVNSNNQDELIDIFPNEKHKKIVKSFVQIDDNRVIQYKLGTDVRVNVCKSKRCVFLLTIKGTQPNKYGIPKISYEVKYESYYKYNDDEYVVYIKKKEKKAAQQERRGRRRRREKIEL